MATNGRISPLSLRTVQDGIKLERNTARQYQTMAAAFHRETGFTMSIARPAGGYRDLALQADMHREWFAGHIPGKYGFSKSSKVPPAVAGGSIHGFGKCVDIAIGAPWAINNAHRFGFSRPFGGSDPNHFQYDGTTVTASLNVTKIIDSINEGDTMILILPTGGYKEGKTLLLADPFTFSKDGLPSERVKALRAIGVPLKKVSATQLSLINDQVQANIATRAAASKEG